MEAKLIKVENTFYLKQDGTILGTSSYPNLSTSIRYSLSLKNCEAIANGYDLDELAESLYLKSGGISDILSFKIGFQKALEILGDKIFSEEDMIKAYLIGCDKQTTSSYHVEKNIQSLQQTEWDCIIEMECVMGCKNLIVNGENSVCCGDKKPKLDAENYSIADAVFLVENAYNNNDKRRPIVFTCNSGHCIQFHGRV